MTKTLLSQAFDVNFHEIKRAISMRETVIFKGNYEYTARDPYRMEVLRLIDKADILAQLSC